jgi:hypothetical protein
MLKGDNFHDLLLNNSTACIVAVYSMLQTLGEAFSVLKTLETCPQLLRAPSSLEL